MCQNCDTGDGFDGFRKYGHFFGYPECCIKQFVKDVKQIMSGKKDPRTETQSELATLMNGYVPCPECAEKIMSGDKSVFEHIDSNRDASAGEFMVQSLLVEYIK